MSQIKNIIIDRNINKKYKKILTDSVKIVNIGI